MPPLPTQADLHRQWRAMLGPLGFTFRRLWLLFLDLDLRSTGLLLQIDGVPKEPSEGESDSLMTMCVQVQDAYDVGRLAVLLSRPGSGGLRSSDRRWGRVLVHAARRAHVPLAPIHVANDDAVVPLSGDDLLGLG